MLNNELKKNPFAVPGNYFDNLPSKVQDKCIVAEKSAVHGFIPKLAWSCGIAVLALVFFLSYLSNTSTNDKKQNTPPRTAGIEDGNMASRPGVQNKRSYRDDVKADYLAVRNINLNDYLSSKY
jgi:hypothetical protein